MGRIDFYKARGRASYLKYTLNARTEEILALIRRHLQAGGGVKRILDVGCADGLMTEELAKRISGCLFFGVERNTGFALGAHDVGNRYMYGDGCLLPVKDGSFDAVVVSAIFKHIPDPEAFIKELKRVLKKDGLIFICDPRPLMVRIGLLTGKFERRWLFNIWSLSDYARFFLMFGFQSLSGGYYMPPMPVPARFEALIKRLKLNFLFLHQAAVFKKTAAD